MFFMESVTHCTIVLGGTPAKIILTTARLAVILLFFFQFLLSPTILNGTEPKVVRYSGDLLRVALDVAEPFFEFEETASMKTKRVYCDLETLKVFSKYKGAERGLSVDGKAKFQNASQDGWQCLGAPNIRKQFRIGANNLSSANSRQVSGQVVEADGNTGQIVYMEARGRRGYLTVAPSLAAEFKSRLDRMETVEISGSFRYDRVRRYFVEE